MKKEITNVRLSFACNEDWNTFKKENERERLCAKCQHTVKDFTEATQEEFNAAMSDTSKQVCGRFKTSQLHPQMMKYAAAVVLAASLSACTTEVAEPAQVEEIKAIKTITMGVPMPSKDWMEEELKLDTVAIDTTILAAPVKE